MNRETEPEFKTMIATGRLILILTVIFTLTISYAVIACDEDDLTDINWQDYKPCMSSGDSFNWCKRG